MAVKLRAAPVVGPNKLSQAVMKVGYMLFLYCQSYQLKSRERAIEADRHEHEDSLAHTAYSIATSSLLVLSISNA